MEQKIYQVDAFADEVFKGNPAAVCPLKKWLADDVLQKIAMENNLSETAFYIRHEDGYQIRWFTPTVEVDLCGHATLATAYVLFQQEGHQGNTITFYTLRSGVLSVQKDGNRLSMNFPADHTEAIELTQDIKTCFNISPVAVLKGKDDFLLVYEDESSIKKLIPDLSAIKALPCRGLIVTARGRQTDFVSRFFAPAVGVNEDPVTGSAHTTLIPYWARKLGKDTLTASQLSARTGFLKCLYLGERVVISGQCKLYLSGNIFLE
jgi:PhzF family phenazine biosynthesis protein